MQLETKPILVALDNDASCLREVSETAAPWFEVIRASSAKRAIELLQNNALVRAIVSEHIVNTERGIALLETACKLRPDVRRVLMSNHGDLAAIIGGLHSGAIQGLVHKPFRPQELLAAIFPNGFPAAGMGTPLRASA